MWFDGPVEKLGRDKKEQECEKYVIVFAESTILC